jgi:hypothetical protein
MMASKTIPAEATIWLRHGKPVTNRLQFRALLRADRQEVILGCRKTNVVSMGLGFTPEDALALGHKLIELAETALQAPT